MPRPLPTVILQPVDEPEIRKVEIRFNPTRPQVHYVIKDQHGEQAVNRSIDIGMSPALKNTLEVWLRNDVIPEINEREDLE